MPAGQKDRPPNNTACFPFEFRSDCWDSRAESRGGRITCSALWDNNNRTPKLPTRCKVTLVMKPHLKPRLGVHEGTRGGTLGATVEYNAVGAHLFVSGQEYTTGSITREPKVGTGRLPKSHCRQASSIGLNK
jgi:hypothetical protein